MKPTSLFPGHVLMTAVLVIGLGACGGSDSLDAPPPSPGAASTVQPPPALAHGYFVGTVRIGSQEYYGDALVTVDGVVRLYVGGPEAGDAGAGLIQRIRPESSAQFVGRLYWQSGQAVGTGLIIGQGCAAASPIRFCSGSASGEISLTTMPSGYVQGTLRVLMNGGEETWSLNLGEWSHYYRLRASPSAAMGRYNEELAEFSADGNTIVQVDQTGQLSFQSSNSGCTGNGALAPHLDAAFYVYDVILTIQNCSTRYSHLNGGFVGLATFTPSSYWNYDGLLRVWVSKPDHGSQAALTMLGQPL